MNRLFEMVVAKYTPEWWNQLPKHHHSVAPNLESVIPTPNAEFHATIPPLNITKWPLGYKCPIVKWNPRPRWQKPKHKG
jgi:hypothetical protein